MKTIHHDGYARLVDALKRRRLALGMTQQDVALRLGCFRTRVGKWEQREVRIDVLDFVRLCTIYRLSPNRLLAELRVEDPS